MMSEKRKAQSQIDDIVGCKTKQRCETKESEPSAKNNTTKSFPTTAKDKSDDNSKIFEKSDKDQGYIDSPHISSCKERESNQTAEQPR